MFLADVQDTPLAFLFCRAIADGGQLKFTEITHIVLKANTRQGIFNMKPRYGKRCIHQLIHFQ
ncbi:hypothetical protein BN135_3351 [Cronobacter muytjensii 530]